MYNVTTAIEQPDKGLENGSCYRRTCQRPNAIWYHHLSKQWYCGACHDWLMGEPSNSQHWESHVRPSRDHPLMETREQMNQREATDFDPPVGEFARHWTMTEAPTLSDLQFTDSHVQESWRCGIRTFSLDDKQWNFSIQVGAKPLLKITPQGVLTLNIEDADEAAEKFVELVGHMWSKTFDQHGRLHHPISDPMMAEKIAKAIHNDADTWDTITDEQRDAYFDAAGRVIRTLGDDHRYLGFSPPL